MPSHETDMNHTPDSPDASRPWAAPMRRRTLLASMTVGAFGFGLASSWPQLALAATANAPDAARFFEASQILTGYDDLDPLTAQRISAAMIAQAPAMAGALSTLADLTKVADNRFSAQSLLAAAKQAGVGEAALALVAAWFKGTVGHGQTAQLVAYRQALMYRPVSDGLIVPTYCGNGPLWWTAPIPDANAPVAGPRTAV
jgi:hypothetical protein